MFRALLLATLCLLSVAPASAKVLAYRQGNALYVVVDYLSGTNKVFRIGIGDGVVDFHGERLIPADTKAAAVVSAYHRSLRVLRHGGEESPPVWLDYRAFGGNHGGISAYERTVLIDGKPVAGNGPVKGMSLTISERYDVPGARIKLDYRFGDIYARFRYLLLPKHKMHVRLGAMQAQRVPAGGNPVVKDGVVRVYAPRSIFLMGYSNGSRLVRFLQTDKGKMYPFAFDGPTSGPISVSGYWGTVPLN